MATKYDGERLALSVATVARGEVFAAAGAYHGAIARYCRVLASGDDIESAAQEVLGRSLFYRAALEQLGDSAIGRRRLRCVKTLVHSTSRQYMAAKKHAA